ncbi:hypothetical protein HY68_12785 [Streptomyces sp. AcH 505]|uniref:DUF6907 domain-containing protein n=1 Tax=Streptomyces sp. AcH 505 TaxID=352211 RepID=UPI000591A130|nr:hypothetical protein HY68_12785 [Streptomyces sp. AcH 505]
MSADDQGPFVAHPVPRNDDGSLTVSTVDHGLIRLDCPYWCTNGHSYPNRVAKANIVHRSDPIWALSVTAEYGEAGHLPVSFMQFPFRDDSGVYLLVEDQAGDDLEFGPAGARKVAESLRLHADVIDGMAAELEVIRGSAR